MPYATRQEMTLSADGTLAPQPVTIVHHAGEDEEVQFSGALVIRCSC